MRFAVVTPEDRELVLQVRLNVGEYWDRRMSAMSEDRAVWISACGATAEVFGWVVLSWPVDERGANVEDLYVREDRPAQGIGTALMLEVERRALERGVTSLWLAVNPEDNEEALRLYERLGYARDGGPRYLDGVYDGYEDWVVDVTKPLRASR